MFFSELIVRDPETRNYFSRQASERTDIAKMMVLSDRAWVRTDEWTGLAGWSIIAGMAWEAAADLPAEATIPASVVTGALAQFKRFVPLSREQRDVIIAWRVWLGHKSIYTTTVGASGIAEIDKRRAINTSPIDDVLYELKKKGVIDEKPSGWHVVR
ncbi:hypothetical protein DQ239_00060 [Blastococcus sp. TF02-09]|uniref:hypothetical protein n=1 Tax=Blastococcus sp. TF02-09 TaxID=2250576 RepID=UPI000DE810E7|nr:hypothetical protein [Blastococcus sp. TF02-9]RBY81064.1 hypothetical protein DQ239_00060 [Blastococcus sp. TF02-9]